MERKEFKNQYGDLVREIYLESKLFSIEIVPGEQEEINDDFFFRYGKTELSKKALELLLNFKNIIEKTKHFATL